MTCCRCQDARPPIRWLDGLGPVCEVCRLALSPQIDAAGIWRPRPMPRPNGHHRTYQIHQEEGTP